MFDTPSAPPAPDPYRTAAAQTGSNLQTAIANAIMGNANEISPLGTVTYRQIGSVPIGGSGIISSSAPVMGGIGMSSAARSAAPGTTTNILKPSYDPNQPYTPYNPSQPGGNPMVMPGQYANNSVTTAGFSIPQFERVVTLSPEQQRLYDQQTRLGSNLNDLAISQVGRLNKTLNAPIQAPRTPIQTRFADVGPIQRRVGPTDFSVDRQKVEDALYSRLNPQLDRDRSALENNLINQGLVRGSDAFTQAMDEANRQANDARQQVVLAGGQEQDRLFNEALQQGLFANAAQNQAFGQAQSRATFNNQAVAQQLQQALSLRNQPINEISALMSGGQVSMPQFAQYNAPNMAGTDLMGAIYNSNAIQQQQYAQQMQARNAAMGGLFGLGSSAILGGASMLAPPLAGASMLGGTRALGGLFSDRRLKRDIHDLGIKLMNGLRLYAYRYLWDAVERVGVMAQDVIAVRPDAVSLHPSGYAMVDLGRATRI